MEYKHRQLIDDLNEFCIALKIHMHQDQITNKEALEKALMHYPKPTGHEIDLLQQRINEILFKDSRPMRRH